VHQALLLPYSQYPDNNFASALFAWIFWPDGSSNNKEAMLL
jgi:hypothetical protein